MNVINIADINSDWLSCATHIPSYCIAKYLNMYYL